MVTRVPISRRAVVQRINRRLEGQGRRLCASRGKSAQHVGDYYLTASNGKVVRTHVNLDQMAREVRALKDYERVSPF